MTHRFLPNDTAEIEKMLLAGAEVESIDDLFRDIPADLRYRGRLGIPGPFAEMEVRRKIEEILARNTTCREKLSFLGGGVWDHYVPAAVDAIASRGEFLTSYTPYQPEVNQGLLQVLFEYQSLICELVDMDVANCSMYDWSSALGEAARMAVRITRRHEVVVPHFMSPRRLAVLRSYAEPAGITIRTIQHDIESGQVDLESLRRLLSHNTAAVYIENPSYLGFLNESLEELSSAVHSAGALLIAGVNPISLGLVKPPGEYGADIAVGEGQPLGNPPSFGGPLLGIFACKDDPNHLRQMPGRIVGLTTTLRGEERAFALSLQTREQHIRREKATSNICSNEALMAVRAATYLSLMGMEGMKQLGERLFQLTRHAISLLSEISSIVVPVFRAVHFNEFVFRIEKDGKTSNDLNAFLLENGMIGGKLLKSEFPELGETSLVSVSELLRTEDLERFSVTVGRYLEEK